MKIDFTVLIVFTIVYAGISLDGSSGLALDRSEIALLGAIAFLAPGSISPQGAWGAVDWCLSVPLPELFFIVGSNANRIVDEQAGSVQVKRSWKDHGRTGIPVRKFSLACAGAWLVLKCGSLGPSLFNLQIMHRQNRAH